MKNFFKTGVALAVSLLFYSPLITGATQQFEEGGSFYPQLTDRESKSMMFPSPGRDRVRIPPSLLVFQGGEFTAKTSTGTEIIEFPASAPIAVIEYPEVSLPTIDTDLGPTASVSFITPPGYDGSFGSVIGFNFLSGSSMVAGSISGTVKFSIQAEVLHADNSLDFITLGTTTTTGVEIAGPAIQGQISANHYFAKITFKEELNAGDLVILKLIRDNTGLNNYEAPVYVSSLFWKYNIGKTKPVKKSQGKRHDLPA